MGETPPVCIKRNFLITLIYLFTVGYVINANKVSSFYVCGGNPLCDTKKIPVKMNKDNSGRVPSNIFIAFYPMYVVYPLSDSFIIGN